MTGSIARAAPAFFSRLLWKRDISAGRIPVTAGFHRSGFKIIFGSDEFRSGGFGSFISDVQDFKLSYCKAAVIPGAEQNNAFSGHIHADIFVHFVIH